MSAVFAMNSLWHWGVGRADCEVSEVKWEQQCSAPPLQSPLCVWARTRRSKKKDQLLIRNHGFPPYLCAIKQMFIFEPMTPTELICRGLQGESWGELHRERSFYEKEIKKKSKRLRVREMCRMWVTGHLHGGFAQHRSVDPWDRFDLVSLSFMI